MFEEVMNARLSELRTAALTIAQRKEWEQLSRGERRGEPAERRNPFAGHGLHHAKAIRKSFGFQK
jgi:hypothetical protein